MPDVVGFTHAIREEEAKAKLIKEQLSNLADTWHKGAKYELDDNIRVAILLELNPNPIQVHAEHVSYWAEGIINMYGEASFENRGENNLQDVFYKLNHKYLQLQALKLLWSIENADYTGIDDDLLLKMLWIHFNHIVAYHDELKRTPWYFNDEIKIQIFNSLPKEQQQILPFSKEIEALSNAFKSKEAKEANGKEQDSDTETHELDESDDLDEFI